MKKNKLSAQQLADFVGCSRRNIYSARTRGLLIADEKGCFDISVGVNAEFIRSRKSGEIRSGRPANVDTANNTTMSEANLSKRIAEAELAQLRAAMARRQLFPIRMMSDFLIPWLERLHTTIERTAGVGAGDLAKKILYAGELTNADRNEFVNLFLKAIHDTKNSMMKEIKNFEITKEDISKL